MSLSRNKEYKHKTKPYYLRVTHEFPDGETIMCRVEEIKGTKGKEKLHTLQRGMLTRTKYLEDNYIPI